MTSAATQELDSDSSRPRWKLNSKCAMYSLVLVHLSFPGPSPWPRTINLLIPHDGQVFDARTALLRDSFSILATLYNDVLIDTSYEKMVQLISQYCNLYLILIIQDTCSEIAMNETWNNITLKQCYSADEHD